MDLAQKNLDAENKKYELGTEINQNVIQAQNVISSVSKRGRLATFMYDSDARWGMFGDDDRD